MRHSTRVPAHPCSEADDAYCPCAAGRRTGRRHGRPGRRTGRRQATARGRTSGLTRLVLGLLLGLGVLVVAPGGAQATVGTDDYPSRLKNAGQDAIADPWNFWNRECVSFVAWRLNNDRNIPFHNYYLGVHWGNATNWGPAARAVGIPVDSTPTRGSVAWWTGGAPSVGTYGHVAYVLRVTTTYITIEEYNYVTRGGYSQRNIPRWSSSYPTGFIHMKPLGIKLVSAPKVGGTAQVGQLLEATGGTWSPSTVTRSYQWFADGKPVDGATRSKFRIGAPSLGKRISVREKVSYSGAKTRYKMSAPTAVVKPGQLETTAAPAILGEAEVGQPLTASLGGYKPRAERTVTWFADGRRLRSVTSPTYTPGPRQLGKKISVKVTARRAGYSALTAPAAPTEQVATGTLVRTAEPSISGTPVVGTPVTAAPGDWTEGSTFSYQWLVDGVAKEGATKQAYTPLAADLGKPLSVEVTARHRGYYDDQASAAATAPVAKGTLVPSQAPSVVGRAKVGVPLTADHGTWSRKSSFRYQWLSEGKPISGATSSTYTPTPDQVNRRLSVQVVASRDGYYDATTLATTLAAAAPGTIHRTARPTFTGLPWVGETLTAAPGAYDVTPQSSAYAWLRDGTPIDGATGETYTLTSDDIGHTVNVQQQVGAAGYDTRTSRARRGATGLHGELTWTRRPTMAGRSVVGQTVTASRGDLVTRGAEVAYQWTRDGHAISGATGRRYRLTTADAGHRIGIALSASKDLWADGETARERDSVTRGLSSVSPSVRVDGRRAEVSVRIDTPGTGTPGGRLTVLLDGREVRSRRVDEAREELTLRRLSRGGHVVRVRYAEPGVTTGSHGADRFRVR